MAEKNLGLIEEVIQAVLKRIDFEKVEKKVHTIDIDIGRLRESVYYIRDDINKIKDKREKKIIEMFKEIKEEMEKSRRVDMGSIAELYTFLVHCQTGKLTMKDLSIADPTIEQVREWHGRLQRLAKLYEDGDVIKKSIVEIENQMKEYIGDKKE